jgi:hypothetical protein
MQKSQIIIISLAASLIVGMYSLPKVLVSDKDKILAAGTPAASTSPAMNETHTTNLSEAQIAVINTLRNNLLNSTDQQKNVHLQTHCLFCSSKLLSLIVQLIIRRK